MNRAIMVVTKTLLEKLLNFPNNHKIIRVKEGRGLGEVILVVEGPSLPEVDKYGDMEVVVGVQEQIQQPPLYFEEFKE